MPLIDMDQTRPGVCENCAFRGLCLCVTGFVKKDEIAALAMDSGSSLPSKPRLICVTCYTTPVGILSPNLAHSKISE